MIYHKTQVLSYSLINYQYANITRNNQLVIITNINPLSILHASLKPFITIKMVLQLVFSLINLGLDKTSIVNFLKILN